MSGGVKYILLAEGSHLAGNMIGLRPSDGSGFSTTAVENALPPCETQWHKMFRQMTYVISVAGTTGTAPSAWSLGAKFEQRLAHTRGVQDAWPGWSPIQDEQLANCILEGVGWYGSGQGKIRTGNAWGTIADQTTVADDGSGVLPSGLTIGDYTSTSETAIVPARVTVSRTITNQLGGMRVKLNPQITGGDSTTQIMVSAIAIGVR